MSDQLVNALAHARYDELRSDAAKKGLQRLCKTNSPPDLTNVLVRTYLTLAVCRNDGRHWHRPPVTLDPPPDQ